MLFQSTVSRIHKFSGVGLHSGRLIRLEIYPAPPNGGIVFVRTDTPQQVAIPARPEYITQTTLCTTLGFEGVQISTIEHLMAAFGGLGVDNATVYVNASELPILDGSAAPFVDSMNEAGLQVQNAKKPFIYLSEGITIIHGDQSICFTPVKDEGAETQGFIEYGIDFPRSQVIGKQSYKMRWSKEEFMHVCEARTFCHMDDVTYMRSKGLALGGSFDNAVVVNHTQVLNAEGLRFPDEFVRHKLLDCIGDLWLLGGVLVGTLVVVKGGHSLHAEFTKKVKHIADRQLSSRLHSGAFDASPPVRMAVAGKLT